MRYVQIACGNHRLDGIERTQFCAECVIPLHSVIEPLQTILRVRRVAGHKVKVFKFQRDHPAFVIERLHTYAVGDGKRFAPCEHGCSGIPLFFR